MLYLSKISQRLSKIRYLRFRSLQHIHLENYRLAMWNDKETDIDLLDHEKIAQTVLEIVSDNHLRPLTIGIYGDWGVGKSSVLSLLQKEITIQNQNGRLNAHTILFNGWLFQGYEDAKTALMETVVIELAKIQPKHKKIQKLASSLLKRVNWLKVAKVSANAFLTGATGIPVGPLLTGASGFVKQAKKLIGSSDSEESGEAPFSTDSEESFFKDAEEQTVSGQIRSFRNEFKELIKTSKVDQVIILVDDLDRCLPKSVIEILEAIRLFLFVEGTTFIISADERMIEYAVREHFPNLPASYNEYTKNYLEKLIQIPIRIPFLNQLQTGNYIKFLMLQNHLKNDFSEVQRVYREFVAERKNPYDNTSLSFETVKKALGDVSDQLKEALFVADQLSPTLTVGLKGNPRNIKRFLNTLFLRIRIAKIYGLDTVIKLNVLAKLMLLERFQVDRFEGLVADVVGSEKGFSETLSKLETNLKTDLPLESKEKDSKTTKEKSADETKFEDWVKLEPPFKGLDIRPYIFISKEKAVGLSTKEELPAHLVSLLEQLNSGSDLALNAASKLLPQIPAAEASRLFDILETESRTVTELKQIPKPVKGLLRIIVAHPVHEERLVELMFSYPGKDLGVWAASNFDGLTSQQGIQKYQSLLTDWAKLDDNATLKSLATSKLKKQ